MEPLRYKLLHSLSAFETRRVIKDKLRTLLNIRVKRERTAAGPRPRVGRRITLGRIRMIVTSDLPTDLWVYLSLQGWREVPVARDRRQYVDLPRESMEALRTSEGTERENLYRRLLRRAAREQASGQASPTVAPAVATPAALAVAAAPGRTRRRTATTAAAATVGVSASPSGSTPSAVTRRRP